VGEPTFLRHREGCTEDPGLENDLSQGSLAGTSLESGPRADLAKENAAGRSVEWCRALKNDAALRDQRGRDKRQRGAE
jgi:hypothetical protein